MITSMWNLQNFASQRALTEIANLNQTEYSHNNREYMSSEVEELPDAFDSATADELDWLVDYYAWSQQFIPANTKFSIVPPAS